LMNVWGARFQTRGMVAPIITTKRTIIVIKLE
jgi:hypothetical protein